MIILFGGSYNGKISYCIEKYNLSKEEFFYCTDQKLKFDKRVICGLHIFVKRCIEKNISPFDYLKTNLHNMKDKIIISDEINSGIVPITRQERIYREECGRCMQFLCRNADEVYRIFFGLEEKLK